jgi:protein-tyrosine-phosphatase
MPHDAITTPLPPPGNACGPYCICCVCLGNICRSPMAEVVLREQLATAGLAGRDVPDPYGGSPEDFAEVLALLESGMRRLVAQLKAMPEPSA